MDKQKGSLSIHSENIFPIIKKWLYSDQDIFIRELVSNACDAITKVKRLDSLGEAQLEENTKFSVKVIIDGTNKTLKFIDNGIGMTEEEVKKYINQIAFSGAEDFFKTYQEKGGTDQIIGHFGLGFYSAFMVANTVEINSLSYQDGAQPIKWRCDGGTEFELEMGTKSNRGTEITLFLSEEGENFLDEYTVRSTIEKYCSFMPYPIYLEVIDKEPEKDEDGNIVIEEPKPLNDTSPLYLKQPSACTDDEYKEFYRSTFNDFKEPLFWIHLNMDYPFNLKGILYFPKLNTQFDTLEGQIKLYNNQVFIADNIKEVIPEFLLLLKGVIDCPDLPLNVSRSFLQNDGSIKKISDYITRKVADKLNSLFKSDRESYEKFWDDINPFIKFGSIKNAKFYDKVSNIILYKTINDQYVTTEEYLANLEGKLENQVYYVTDQIQQAQYIKMLKAHDLDAVILDHTIDSAFISHVESKKEGLSFKRVDSDIADLMKDTDDSVSEEEQKNQTEAITNVFKEALGKDSLKINIESLKSEDVAGMITLSEDSRRMQDMMKMYSMDGLNMNAMPTEETLVLNKKHSLIQYILENKDNKSDLLNMIAQQVYDLALLTHKTLPPEDMSQFIKRSNDIMNQLINEK
ncbi:molecular chaperone HtpG [Serpentinicella sp. ANB-PHB4]|uniref:molecular chaperone HtpG n=1 Tax=Serpentinicella sp. ANB-PHB4 TaxID=3074076 RepID=UPI00285A01BD|nr:molecular chaperone HtpG [Serpentinicella sp. ANB-PHB4]MDR5658506.1 molecular chaperone HtpG [Serpentinicella sp. ANB-PHB4]